MAQAVAAGMGPAAAPNVRVTGRRILAIIVDGLIIGLVTSPLAFAMDALFGTEGSSGVALQGPAALVFFLLSFVIFFGYFILLEGSRGQTVGKMLLGIKVIREDTGGTPGLKAATIRTLLRLVDGLFGYLVGFIVVMASSERRRLGDMAAHTLVVRK